MSDDAARKDALSDLVEMKRREAAAWRRIAERKYSSTTPDGRYVPTTTPKDQPP